MAHYLEDLPDRSVADHRVVNCLGFIVPRAQLAECVDAECPNDIVRPAKVAREVMELLVISHPSSKELSVSPLRLCQLLNPALSFDLSGISCIGLEYFHDLLPHQVLHLLLGTWLLDQLLIITCIGR